MSAPIDTRLAWDAGAPAFLTPSYRGDLERCALLFESIDRHVRGRGPHYVIVHDEDVPCFASFASPDRLVLPASRFLPRWLLRIPAATWKGRPYWWSFRSLPISGWHAQQIVKIAAAATLPHARFCIVDSDNAFFRTFDAGAFREPRPAPLLVHPLDVDASRPRHVAWAENAHRLLGLPTPALPADDYIDQIIVWDRGTVRAMTARIEAIAGCGWAAALCRAREFSEYIVYGTFAVRDPEAARRHRRTVRSFCRTHWGSEPLGERDIVAMLDAASSPEVALCVQSFGATEVSTIRAGLDAFARARAPEVGATAVA